MNEGENRIGRIRLPSRKAVAITIASLGGVGVLVVAGRELGHEMVRQQQEYQDLICGGPQRQNCVTQERFRCFTTGMSSAGPLVMCETDIVYATKTPTILQEGIPDLRGARELTRSGKV